MVGPIFQIHDQASVCCRPAISARVYILHKSTMPYLVRSTMSAAYMYKYNHTTLVVAMCFSLLLERLHLKVLAELEAHLNTKHFFK